MTEIGRVLRSKEAAKTSYNRMSKVYDLLTGGSEKKYEDIGLESLNARAGETVLEIGFGTGKALVSLARLVEPGGRVYGLDISEGMLAVAQRRLLKAGLSDRVEIKCGDAPSSYVSPWSYSIPRKFRSSWRNAGGCFDRTGVCASWPCLKRGDPI
jgi:SAM-dependent methyltransferase